MIDTTYYVVTGLTPAEWAASSASAAARFGLSPRALAMTANYNKWVYALRPSAYGCEPRDVNVILGITFVMPRLASDSGVSADDMSAWRGLVRYLWVHEQTHAAIATRSAVEFRDSLRVLHSGECGLLRARAGEVSNEVTAKYNVLQRALDDREHAAQHSEGQIRQFRGSRLAVDTTFRDTVPLFRSPR
jgi:predicted secreted Zn-dependent protease